MEVLLTLGARIDVLVLDLSGLPMGDVEIQVSIPAYWLTPETVAFDSLMLGTIDWKCTSDASGRCSIDGLPPNVPLSVGYHKEAEFTRRESSLLTLVAGEVREIRFRLGAGASILGQLVDHSGAPVSDQKVWMKPATLEAPTYFQSHDDDDVTSRRSDSSGSFVFEDVSEGGWLIGPSPDGPYAARGEFVRVGPNDGELSLVLTVHRDLFIRGVVTDPSGRPVEGVHVGVDREGELVWIDAESDEAGLFAIGPLTPGVFSVQSVFGTNGFAGSDPVLAHAGEENVQVRLQPGAVIRGIMVHSDSGLPTSGWITVSLAGNRDDRSTTWWMRSGARESGKFELDGVEPGTYNVVGTTEDGKVGIVSNVIAAAGRDGSDIVLEAKPGALLHLRFEGSQPYGHFFVPAGDAVVACDGVPRGTSSTQVVPSGPLTIELSWQGRETPEIREINLEVGEEKEITFGSGE